MRFFALIAFVVVSHAQAENFRKEYKCVSHRTLQLHDLVMEEKDNGYMSFYLDGTQLDEVETAPAESGADIMVWPMNKSGEELDELYCKPQ